MGDTMIETLNQGNSGSFLVPEIWSKDIIYANIPNFIFKPYSSRPLEANASTVRFAVMGTINPGGTLSRGTTVNAGTLTFTQITATPLQFGNAITWEGVEDVLSFTNMRDNVGYVALRNDYGQYIDRLCYLELLKTNYWTNGGTWGTFAGTYGNGSNSAPAAGTLGAAADQYITADVITDAVGALKNRFVPTFEDGKYKAILHVNQVIRLYKDGTFREVQRYMTSEAPLINGVKANGWRCAYAGVDIFETTQIDTCTMSWGTAGTVSGLYMGVMFGQNAFGDGWAEPMNITYYPDVNFDGFRHKKLMWTALGLVKLLKPENVQVIMTKA